VAPSSDAGDDTAVTPTQAFLHANPINQLWPLVLRADARADRIAIQRVFRNRLQQFTTDTSSTEIAARPLESVLVLSHPLDDYVDFSPLVLDIENILADAIVTCIVRVDLSRSVFGLTPRERWWA
jgi:hypothetical protein